MAEYQGQRGRGGIEVWVPPRALPGAEFHNLATLAYDAWRGGRTQVWIHDELRDAMRLPAELPAARGRAAGVPHRFVAEALGEGWVVGVDPPGLAPWMPAWQPGTERYVEVAVPAWDQGSPWRACPTPIDLMVELARFMAATQAAWHRSGAITSDRIIRDHWRRSRLRIEASEVPPPGVPMRRGMRPSGEEGTFSWARPALGPEARARFCHAFDVNGMFLSAASGLSLPVGPVEHAGPGGEDAAPGYWLVEPELHDPHLPAPYRPDGRGAAHVWMTTPGLEHSRKLHLHRRVLDSFIWPESHQWLQPWYKTLRDARRLLIDSGGGVALDALKSVYRAGIGRLGSERRYRDDDPLAQPYWRSAVIAEARWRLMRRLVAARQNPIAVDVDCAWYLTNTEDPVRFAGRVGLEISDELGRMRHAGTTSGRVARDALAEARPSAIIRSLKAAS